MLGRSAALVAVAFLVTGASSASGSYPNFAILSASSFALRSAASKSITSPVTFFAPNFVFLAPNTLALRGPDPIALPLRNAAEEVVRLAAGAAPPANGDAVRAMPFPLPFAFPALRKGDGVRPTTAGVAVRETGGVGFLIAGVSQEEKKSFFGSPAGVEVPSGPLLITSVMYTTCEFSFSSSVLAAASLNHVSKLVDKDELELTVGQHLLAHDF